MQIENGSEVFRRKDNFIVMMTKPIIEDVGDRPHEDVENELQEADERSEMVPDGHFVLTGAVRLRKDLSEDHHRHS